ncbi:dihydrofolate reductase [Pontibacillus salipaludis]|uniref:dihydrofolate reductase n=1 Tax=Pontibacillus salipaludis TaxID=1697394 RepID=UPI0031E5CDBB
MISFLVAMDRNRLIGKDNDLPWRLPNDLKFFKSVSTGKTIIMGRKTFESMNGPLPNRKNVVLTRDANFQEDGCDVIHSLEPVFEWEKEDPNTEYLIIGGSHIFEQTINEADRMYITWIEEDFEGDTYFPEFNEDEWTLTKKERGVQDEKNPYEYYFCQYDRKQ